MSEDLVVVLAEPNRRRLLELLSRGERTVSDLAAEFGVTRPAISQHLGVLAAAGLVESRPDGRYRYYRLVPAGMAALRDALDAFWTDELARLADRARQPRFTEPTKETEMAADTSIEPIVDTSVVVALDPDATFALLTEPERIRRWQGITARVDLRAGGDFRFTVVPGGIGGGIYTEVEPGRRLVLAWGWEGDDALPPGASTVTITLEPVEGGTHVHLVHTGLNEDQAQAHTAGWEHFLDRLAVAAAEGDAGPDLMWAERGYDDDPFAAPEAALAICQGAVRDLAAADGTRSTPCPDYDVDGVVDHLLLALVNVGGAVGASTDAPDDVSVEVRVAEAGARTIEAFRARGVDGTVSFGPMEMPATLLLAILQLELLVHAWDVAQATGRSVVAPEALCDHVLGQARAEFPPQLRAGRFAEELEPGIDATNLDRLLAYTGRRA